MAIAKEYDEKKKCYHIPHNAKALKRIASAIADLLKNIPVIGIVASAAKKLAKEIYLEQLKAKNYCKEDIEWVKKNI